MYKMSKNESIKEHIPFVVLQHIFVERIALCEYHLPQIFTDLSQLPVAMQYKRALEVVIPDTLPALMG